jgi:hypothetical protein
VLWKVTGLPGSGVVEMEQVTSHGVWRHAGTVIEQDGIVDAAPAQGNFTHLRFRTAVPTEASALWGAGLDHEVVGFWTPAEKWGLAADGVRQDANILQRMRLVWNGSLPSVGNQFAGFYHAPTRPPDEMLPLHIGYQTLDNLYGGTWSTWSVDLIQLVRDLYDGGYQDPADVDITTVRYDADIFDVWDASTNPDGLISHPSLPFWGNRLRITRPWGLYEVAEAVYQALGLVGFVDSQNRVAPRRVLLPDEHLVADPDTLPLIDDSDIRKDSPPSWRQAGRSRYTVAQYGWITEGGVWDLSGGIGIGVTPEANRDNPGAWAEQNLDFIVTREDTYEAVHPNVANLGRAVLDVWLGFMHNRSAVEAYAQAHAASVFERWAYGAIETDMAVLEGAPALQPGDLCRLQSALYPNLAIQDRGGTRVLQVLQVSYDRSGRWLHLIDVGAANQPVGTPTLALAKNTTYPKTHVDVTITAVPTDARWELQVVATDSATPPALNDAGWAQWRTGYGNDTFTIGPMPAGAYIHGRIRASLPDRITSAWGTAQTVNLDASATPTSLTVGSLTGSTALATWTVGDASLAVEVRLQEGAGSVDTVKHLPAGTEQFLYTGLAASTAYTAYVRHRDAYGQPGPAASQGFSTTGVLPALGTPMLVITKGDQVGTRYGWPA